MTFARLFETIMSAYWIFGPVVTLLAATLLYYSARRRWRRWIPYTVIAVLSLLILPIPFALESHAVFMPWAVYAINSWLFGLVMLPGAIIYFFLLRFAYQRLAAARK